MPVTTIEISGARVPLKVWASEIEPAALSQLRSIASLPWVVHHVAVMPDVHFGRETTVGAVVATRDAIFPAVVGTDVGCGMAAVATSLRASDLPDDLRALRLSLEGAVPIDEHAHCGEGAPLLAKIPLLDRAVHDLAASANRQLGTLGGGNHFIELCVDGAEGVWLLLHSGGRDIGRAIAEMHMSRAARLSHNLVDPAFAAFLAGTREMEAYRHDLSWAEEYAAVNRARMIDACTRVLVEKFSGVTFAAPITCHHNYVALEQHHGESLFVTRRGAISARAGQLGIIPGSMGDKSFIVRGLGNPDSFCSASHGAGRRMSRVQARQQFSLDDLRAQTSGVECRKDLLEEIPAAHKPIDQVMAMQQDLVEVVAELKQLLCIKG